jgi:class 3 adenylate cyclase
VATDKRTPKRAGVWENLGTAPEEAPPEPALAWGWLRSESTPGEVHRAHLLLAFVALGALLVLLDTLGTFALVPRSGAAGELDLHHRLQLVTAFWGALLQVVAFALLLFLTIQTRGGHRELLWLALFFGSAFVYALHRLTVDPLAWFLRTLALVGWSTSLLAYGAASYSRHRRWRRRLDRLCLAAWLGLVLALTFAYTFRVPGAPWLEVGRLAVALLPLGVYLVAAGAGVVRGGAPGGDGDRPARTGTLVLLLGLYVLHLADDFGLYAGVGPLRSPLFLPFLSCLVFYFAAGSFADALRSVTFYGRFIRPGLKRLLQQKGRSLFGDEKLFRGRKTVIMKIDMANYTRTTFDMPYGMRRLFQDLWFTLIDRVVADQVFLDKSLGDGSVYCFEDRLPGGSCTAALSAALEIRERQMALFDRTYRERLRAMLEETPELAAPAEVYLESYREKIGESFWERRTRIRIALVTGYVDEGLWGLTSQSHYDVQGGPLVLATRFEAQAENGEIVFDHPFLEELEEESPGLLDRAQLVERQVELKGIGTRTLYALPAEVDPVGVVASGSGG